MLLDSSVVTLCLSLFNWAHYSEEKGAIKIHALLSINDFLPMASMCPMEKRSTISGLIT